jgi:ABC-type lipoprotein release transport system permease subunit
VAFRPPESTETFRIIPTLRLSDSVVIAGLVLLMSLVASFLPAHFASKLDPIQALGRN